jgi:hypothetical protein
MMDVVGSGHLPHGAPYLVRPEQFVLPTTGVTALEVQQCGG